MSDIFIVFLVLGFYFSPVFYQLFIVIKESKRGNKVPLRKFKKIFKYSCLILVPLAIAFGILIKINYLDYEAPITYNGVDHITFENFRGFEFFKKSLYGSKRFAYVVTTMESEIGEDSVMIQSLFHPSRSFVYNSYSNNKNLLSHEIYHFKITELFCRKAKQEITSLEHPTKKDIIRTIDRFRYDEREYQKKYDNDTFHSYVFGVQKKYERKIDSLLNLLSKFEKPKIVINE